MTELFKKNQELIDYVYANFNDVPKGSDDYEKMISGMRCWVPELKYARMRRHERALKYGNISIDDFETPDEYEQARLDYLKTVFGNIKGEAFVEAPFYVDYGFNIEVGDKFYANFNLTILDGSIVKIGHGVALGPNVTLTCATHPLDPYMRVDDHYEWSREIIIGNRVWLGANVTVLAGVHIGDNVVVGANSVVTKDIPANSVAVGIPARVVKKLEVVERGK
ncbi:unnamed protein product [Wickerhamomyces anomalus]